MHLLDLLKQWFDRDIRHVNWRDVETIVDQPAVAEIRFSTMYFTYTITADENHGESFLGGTCYDRQRRTTQYLPEAVIDEDTWHDIVEAIQLSERISERPLPGRLF